MYTPQAFATDEIAAFNLIDAIGFGILVSQCERKLPAISHLPFILDRSARRLVSHMARENPHWRSFAPNRTETVVFQGTHGYISPRWYESSLAVPTWNYEAVQIHGTCTIIDDADSLAREMDALIRRFEGDGDNRWQPPTDEQYADFAGRMRQAIVGFELRIEHIEGKAKLSQNRPPADQRSVIAGLAEEGGASAELARRMEAVLGINR